MSTPIRATHAISFRLLDREGHSDLGIYDGAKGQTSTLEITNSSRRNLKPKKLTGAEPTATNHHFELKFRAGTLNVRPTPAITVDAGDAGWKISNAVDTSDGVSFYLMMVNPPELKAGNKLAVKLNNLSAVSTGGDRGSRLELKWGQGVIDYLVNAGEQAESLVAGHRMQHINIVERRGEQRIPLHVDILGANKISNDGKVNVLTVRITNVMKAGAGTIQLNKTGHADGASEFGFSFEVSDSYKWAIATKSQAKAINMNAVAGSKAFDTHKDEQGESPVWRITPKESFALGPNEFIDVTISNITTSLPAGETKLYLHYKNIPGYWNGDFVCVIEKAPVVYKEGKVGIGNPSPLGPLSVGDSSVDTSDGFIVLGKKAGTNTRQYRMGFDSSFNFVIGDYGFNNTAGTWTSPFTIAWNAPNNSLFINGSGNVGIATDDPKAKLSVNGKLRVENEVSVGGSGAVEIDAPGIVGGRFKINSDGKVGIGTSTPGNNINTGAFFKADKSGRILDVYSKDNEAVLILGSNQDKDEAHLGGVYFMRTAGQGDAHREVAAIKCRQANQGTLAGGKLQFFTKPNGQGCGFDAPRMVIGDTGEVGIGTTWPKAMLHVNGDVRIAENKEIFFENNGQIRSADNHHRILFRRGDNKMELREFGDIVFSPGATSPGGPETAKVVILSNGNVGIGNSSPGVPLEIGSFHNYDIGGGFWYAFKDHSRIANPGAHVNSISARAEGGFLSKTGMYVVSDLRVKNVLNRSVLGADLNILSQLQVTDYKYVDVITQGEKSKKGLIAQEVEEIFPQAVSKQIGVVPDLYCEAVHANGWIEMPNDLKVGDRVRLIAENAEGVYEVLEATPEKFRTDFKPESAEVFVYGREVKDFRILDYDAITVLNVSATQQLKKELDQEVKTLRAENTELRAANDTLEKRLQLLESKLEAVLGVMSVAAGANGNGKH